MIVLQYHKIDFLSWILYLFSFFTLSQMEELIFLRKHVVAVTSVSPHLTVETVRGRRPMSGAKTYPESSVPPIRFPGKEAESIAQGTWESIST